MSGRRRKLVAVGGALVAVAAAAGLVAICTRWGETPPPPSPAAMAEVAWGEPVKGLVAGLEVEGRRFEAGAPINFTCHTKNTGRKAAGPMLNPARDFFWQLVFAPDGGAVPLESYTYICVNPGEKDCNAHLAAGEERSARLPFTLGPSGSRAGYLLKEQRCGGKEVYALAPGRYTVTARFGSDPERIGVVTTGPVEIEIVALAKGAAVPSPAATAAATPPAATFAATPAASPVAPPPTAALQAETEALNQRRQQAVRSTDQLYATLEIEACMIEEGDILRLTATFHNPTRQSVSLAKVDLTLDLQHFPPATRLDEIGELTAPEPRPMMLVRVTDNKMYRTGAPIPVPLALPPGQELREEFHVGYNLGDVPSYTAMPGFFLVRLRAEQDGRALLASNSLLIRVFPLGGLHARPPLPTGIAWSEYVGNLRLGLRAPKPTVAAGEALPLTVFMQSAKGWGLDMLDDHDPGARDGPWRIRFRPLDGSAARFAQWEPERRRGRMITPLNSVDTETREITVQPDQWRFGDASKPEAPFADLPPRLPPGRYAVQVSYQNDVASFVAECFWTGTVATGEVEIEIVAPAAPSASPKPPVAP